ncbi:MAG TPA: TlpA disulfide reductase family protein [Gemmatimonadaceae bacterium]|nr:TlpA disulfide reductase family protein [Gemmatimonadaceae bacterium]
MAVACVFSPLAPHASPLLAQDSGIEVGSPAPDAALETLDGKPVRLSQHIGKAPVVLEFWATWCPNCKQLEPLMAALHEKYGSQVRFVTVAVSINQSPARVKQYVAKYRVPGDVWFDRKGEASGAYDVAATSYVVVIDRAGKVVYTGLGGKQDLEAAIKKAM